MKWIQRVFTVVIIYAITIVYIVFLIRDNVQTDERLDIVKCVNTTPLVVKPTLKAPRQSVLKIAVRQFGPGITGNGVEVKEDQLTEEDLARYRQDYQDDDFNGFLSDIISLSRIIDDTRPDVCRQLHYPDELPATGVVIPFRNEHLSILLRTVYSILHNSPDHLLQEIILVDDGSDHNELKTILDIHVANLQKVKLIRLPTSVGLMRARQTGIDAVTAGYFICMDCHMEVYPGWLEPLMYRLVQKPNSLLCSNIGAIDRHTFKILHSKLEDVQHYFPALLFNLDATTFKYNQQYKRSRVNITDPLPFAIVQGMMIVMRKAWFQQLGGFDPGMKIWGSEQMEIAIKVWTCGGSVEMIPCSYVVHMYRRNVWQMKDEGVLNILRVANVWMDEHKHRVHEYYKHRRIKIDIGDVSDRKRIREENQCKPFQFYLDTLKQFGEFEFTEVRLKGSLRNAKTDKCFDTTPERHWPVQFWCHGETFQYLEWMESGRIRFLEHCLVPTQNDTLELKKCLWEIKDLSSAIWDYNQDAGTVVHVQSKRCITALDDGEKVGLLHCTGESNQKWTWAVL